MVVIQHYRKSLKKIIDWTINTAKNVLSRVIFPSNRLNLSLTQENFKANPQKKQKHIIATILILMPFFLFLLTPNIIQAQQPTATPGISTVVLVTPTITPDIERRLYQIEIAQSQTVDSLKSTNDYNRFLFSVTGAIIALLVGIQSFATLTQLRREGKRDLAESAGVKQVSDILRVVEQSLQSRLAAEEEARKKAIEAEGKLAEVAKKFERLDVFYQNFQSNIKKLRNELESDALQWANTIPRHGFKDLADILADFANRFDRFNLDSGPVEEEKQEFSTYVLYIRGIAGHYTNQPEVAEKYLKRVVSYQQPESGEDTLSYNRRIANTYYYLGIIKSNFGHNQNALDYFEQANKHDVQGRDFLTRVVIAEAYLMAGDFDKAEKYLDGIERKIQEIQHVDGQISRIQLRLWSRTKLIRANIAIIKRDTNWEGNVQELLHPIRKRDATYYYGIATLAQAYYFQGNNEVAKQLFHEVYDTIIALPDMNLIREVRSKILLLMFAGMAANYVGLEKQSMEYLNRAHEYCNDLPKIDSKTCTVFSPLSKKNENVETIKSHIELIRKGILLS